MARDTLTNMTKQIKTRLEYLRIELRAERISYDELHELQSLAAHIKPGDIELLEAAGIPDHRPENCECDNTHEQQQTCCMPCWKAGFRIVALAG